MTAKQVKIYTTPSCPWCMKVKSFLSENGVEFEAVDVAADRAGRNEMIDKSGQMGVPVVEIDGDITVGFQESALREKLGI